MFNILNENHRVWQRHENMTSQTIAVIIDANDEMQLENRNIIDDYRILCFLSKEMNMSIEIDDGKTKKNKNSNQQTRISRRLFVILTDSCLDRWFLSIYLFIVCSFIIRIVIQWHWNVYRENCRIFNVNLQPMSALDPWVHVLSYS
jgi:hypothetical protein